MSEWPGIHKRDLSKWTAKTGLSIQLLDELTKTASNDDGTDGGVDLYIVENIDTKTLPKQILLSTWEYGTGHCMTLYLLQRIGSQFKKVWQSEENLCTESVLGAAKSQAMPDGRIIVRFREYSARFDPAKEKGPVVLRVKITYKREGSTYSIAGRTERPEPQRR